MRLSLVTLIAATLVPAFAYADAPITFEVADHGDSVEVIAHNVSARGAAISSVRSRIEIPVTGQPISPRQLMSDGTVMLVEFDGIQNRVLSVKTKLDRPEVKLLAGLAKATQIGTDLHVVFPRHGVAAIALPASTHAPIAAVPAPTVIAPKTATAPTPIAPKATPTATPTLSLAPAPALAAPKLATPAPTATPLPAHPLPASTENLMTSPGIYGLGALLTLVACGYLMKKKKKETAAAATIEVIAQRSLGSKAKVMWLSAGGREMLVSVTQQNVRMLGQWPKSDRDGAQKDLPRATQLERGSFQQQLAAQAQHLSQHVSQTLQPPAMVEPVDNTPAPLPQSAAVAGILRLRARTATVQPPEINEDVATGDADADMEWAKEILTASGGRR